MSCWGDAEVVRDEPPGPFVTIAAGRFTTCGLRQDRTVACWGTPDGAGTVPPEGELVAITAGDGWACGLRPDMTVTCWSYPGGSPDGVPEGRFRTLAMRGETTCGLRADGSAACWGFEPTQGHFPTEERFTALAVGWLKLCGLDDDGVVSCFGDVDRSPFGTEPMARIAGHPRGGVCGLTRDGGRARCFGFDERTTMPESVDGPFEDIVVGHYFACGHRADGTLECWGGAPATTPEGPFEEVVACEASVCGRRADGSVECGGHPYYGQAHPPEGEFTAVASGRDRSCAIRATDRSVVCWGGPPSPPFEPPSGAFASIDVDDGWACGLRDDGRVECWGDLRFGRAPPADARFERVMLAGALACGITAQHRARCWGANAEGLPVEGLADVADVEVGVHLAMVRHRDDRLTCFTLHEVGEGGGGAPAMEWGPSPCLIGSADEIVSTDALACWLTDAEGLRCRFYGADDEGEPVRLAPATVRDVSATHDEVCARHEDGRTECWGANGWAETSVPDGARFTTVAPGYDHVCALDAERHLVCWGSYAGTPL